VQAEIYLRKYLSTLISNPERVSEDDIALLKDSVRKYPYFQALHLLLARASIGMPQQEDQFATTALYTNGPVLHRFISGQFTAKKTQPFTQPLSTEQVDLNSHADEQETFEEIREVDYHDYLAAENARPTIAEAPPVETIEDNFVLENIAATDFFAFEENFIADPVKQELAAPAEVKPEAPEPVAAAEADYDPERETSEVTNYNDDSLPYTFLWWLAKTRREHQSIFQPYVSRKKQSNPSELQQQYVEHIFHIQSPFNAEEIISTIPEVKGDPKDLAIIDQFIKNAPQISAPRPEQIDNENKAKKSAEDHNDLVSETLAKIYIEQMLYHKAIETYEKLSLKFPEKSRYFADLIQSIKKKI
jgi:hypothetical protein